MYRLYRQKLSMLEYVHCLQPSLYSRWPPPQGSKAGRREGVGDGGDIKPAECLGHYLLKR